MRTWTPPGRSEGWLLREPLTAPGARTSSPRPGLQVSVISGPTRGSPEGRAACVSSLLPTQDPTQSKAQTTWVGGNCPQFFSGHDSKSIHLLEVSHTGNQ